MAGKQLQVVVTATDRANPVLARVQSQIARVGAVGMTALRSITAPLRMLNTQLFSTSNLVRNVVIGITGVAAGRSLLAAADQLDEVAKAAKRLGIDGQQLSVLRYAAGQAGIDFNTLAEGAADAQKRLAQFAMTGGGKAADAVRALNLRLRDSEGRLRGITELLPEIAAGLAGRSAGERIFLAERLFGGQGDRFLELLDGGADGLARMGEEARRLGVVFTDRQLRIGELVGDAADRVKNAWLGLRVKVLDEIGPFLGRALDKVASFLSAVPKMVGTLVGNISAALAGDEVALERWRALLLALSNLVTRNLTALWEWVISYHGASINAVLSLLDTRVGLWLRKIPLYVQSVTVDALAKIINGVTVTIQDAIAGLDPTQDWGDLAPVTESVNRLQEMNRAIDANTRAQLDALTAQMDSAVMLREVLDRMLSDGNLAAAREQMAATFTVTTAAMADAVDGLTGFRDALAATSLAGMGAEAAIAQLNEPLVKLNRETERTPSYLQSIRDGLNEVALQVSDTYQVVQTLTVSVSQSLASGLTDGFIAAIEGARSFEEAMKDALGSTLRMIAQTIGQMLVLRAISGIGGALFGGAGAASSAAGALGGPANLFSAGNAGVGGSGFAGFGFARGTNFAPGGVARVGERGAEMVYLPRGSRVASAERSRAERGGASTSINVVVNVSGGADRDGGSRVADMKRAVTEAVLDALRRSPGYREQVKGLLA